MNERGSRLPSIQNHISVLGNGGESNIKKDDRSSVTTISIGENENELEEFNRYGHYNNPFYDQ